jgi:hypothetical protein
VRRAVLASALAAAVVGLGALLRLLPETIATGDGAVSELYVLHALRGPWLLGPYSQFYWNHPGPLLFYVLAPLYALAGERALALNLGAALINVGAVAWLLRRLARTGEPVAAATAGVAVAIWLVRCAPALDSFWNPVVIALPAALFVVLCADAAAGRATAPVAVIGVGAFLAQSHIGLVPVVGGLTVAAVVGGGLTARRRDDLGLAWWRGTLAACLIGALLWAPPIVEELTGQPGNLTIIAEYVERSPPPPRRLLESASVWATALTGIATPGFGQPIGVPAAPGARPALVAATVAGVGLLIAIAWRRRQRPALAAAAGCCALAAIVALPAIHRSPELVGDYTVFWLSAVGALAAGLIAAWPLTGQSGGVVARVVPVLVVGVAVALAGVRFAGHVSAAAHAADETADHLDRSLDTALRRRGVADPIVFIADPVWADAAGTLLRRYKRREPFAVDPAWRFMYGRPLVATACHDHALRFDVPGSAGDGEIVAAAGDTIVWLGPRACPIAPLVAH